MNQQIEQILLQIGTMAKELGAKIKSAGMDQKIQGSIMDGSVQLDGRSKDYFTFVNPDTNNSVGIQMIKNGFKPFPLYALYSCAGTDGRHEFTSDLDIAFGYLC